MTERYVFSTSDPGILAAFYETRDAIKDFSARLKADCEALGGNDGAYVRRGIWGHPDEITALKPDGSGTIPEGWRIVREQLEPRRGKPGEAARQWLADHQPPDMRHVMSQQGLPRHSIMPAGDGFKHYPPTLFEHEGTLWAGYRSKPGDNFLDTGPCTWTPRKLSEYFAAKAAVLALEESAEAVNAGV